ncbi:MAG: hypothetical protein LBU32_07925, partial [Clostridiales bacterium]|nr:hypothetical protein [Clostridiales bacterium]
RLACGFGGLGVWWPLLLRLPLGERKKIPMASVAFDIAIYNSFQNLLFCKSHLQSHFVCAIIASVKIHTLIIRRLVRSALI